SIVIPMYNEAPRFEEGVGRILEHVTLRYPNCELFLVDDGSRDGTGDRAEKVTARHPALQTTVVRLPGQHGKGAAIREGMLRAKGKIRVFMDADNGTPIEELDRLLPLVRSERTIVIGSRGLDVSMLEKRQPWWRERMGRGFNAFLRWILGLPYRDTQCGF